MTRLSALLVLTCTALHGQLSYSRADSMIPMRDGVHLYTQEYVSSVPALAVKDPRERRALLDHKLRTREEAASRVRQLERSEVPR